MVVDQEQYGYGAPVIDIKYTIISKMPKALVLLNTYRIMLSKRTILM